MDLHQIQYILTIAEKQSISKAAESLFITQSALNQQLLKLEHELGVPLFERRNRIMIPTAAGEVYLDAARQMVDLKRKTYKIIQDIADEKSGKIRLAYTPETGARMFSAVYPLFLKMYPDISFQIYEARCKEIKKLLLNKTVDLAHISYFDFSRSPELEYLDIDSEHIVLGLPASHPLACLAGKNSHQHLPLIDLSLLKDDAFVLADKSTLMRDALDFTFFKAGFTPQILFESASSQTLISMVQAQIAPAFFPQSYVRPDPSIVYFTAAPRFTWTRGIAFRKGTYLSKPEKHFIALSTDYMRGMIQKGKCE